MRRAYAVVWDGLTPVAIKLPTNVTVSQLDTFRHCGYIITYTPPKNVVILSTLLD